MSTNKTVDANESSHYPQERGDDSHFIFTPVISMGVRVTEYVCGDQLLNLPKITKTS